MNEKRWKVTSYILGAILLLILGMVGMHGYRDHQLLHQHDASLRQIVRFLNNTMQRAAPPREPAPQLPEESESTGDE